MTIVGIVPSFGPSVVADLQEPEMKDARRKRRSVCKRICSKVEKSSESAILEVFKQGHCCVMVGSIVLARDDIATGCERKVARIGSRGLLRMFVRGHALDA